MNSEASADIRCGAHSGAQQETHAPQQTSFLFDQLVGACEEGVRNGQPERFGGAFVQNQFKSASLNDG